MTGGLEGAADAVTAGLTGRAVEPQADGGCENEHGGRCLNCGTALIGEHCHACGQSAHLHRSIGAIGHEIAHGVFHFEGKIWRTLPMLVWRPGELTRRYTAGERAKFVSPLAMFLFSVFLMFAIVANLPGAKLSPDFMRPGVSESVADIRGRITENRKSEQARLARLRRDLATAQADPEKDPERAASLAKRIDAASKSIADLSQAESVFPAPPVAARSKGQNWFERTFEHARQNPELILYKIKTSAYKYSWALIPISIPFLWLLFPFSRRFKLYDHAIFATYSLTFMSLLTIALALLSAVGVRMWTLAGLATIVPVMHIYKQLKGAYSLGRTSAVLRTFVLAVMIVWLIVPAFTLMLVYLGIA